MNEDTCSDMIEFVDKKELEKLNNPQNALMGYLLSSLEVAICKDSLKKEIEEQFMNDLQNGQLSPAERMKLYEILSMKESKREENLLKTVNTAMLSSIEKSKTENNSSKEGEKESNLFTKKDYEKAKDVLDYLRELENSEGSDK